MDYKKLNKIAGLFSAGLNLAKKVVGSGTGSKSLFGMGSGLLKTHLMWSAVPAAIAGATTQGNLMTKATAGAKDFVKNAVNPRNFASNIVGYNTIPSTIVGSSTALGKAMSKVPGFKGVGKVLQMGSKKNYLGDKPATFANKLYHGYLMGENTNTVANMGLGMGVGEPVTQAFNGSKTVDLYKNMVKK